MRNITGIRRILGWTAALLSVLTMLAGSAWTNQTAYGAPLAETTVAGKYNALAMALDNGTSTASDLLTSVNTTSSVTVRKVLRYNVGSGFITYDPDDPFSSDFLIQVGDPLFVLVEGSSPSTYSLVGDVPEAGSVEFNLVGSAANCQFNYISIPLDQSGLDGGHASDLALAIGNVAKVLTYEPAFGFITYQVDDPFSSDFAVQIGYPYFVCMTNTTPFVWP